MKLYVRGVWILLLLGMVGFLFGGQSQDPADDKKGVVTYADGQVKRKTNDTENWEKDFKISL